jgi:hypothetical protein
LLAASMVKLQKYEEAITRLEALPKPECK